MNRQNKKKVIIDGPNVAYAEKNKQGKPKLSNIINAYKKLHSMGYDPYVIVDASFRYDLTEKDRAIFENMVAKNQIKQSPADTDADYFILQFAETQDAFVVTNDQYDNYRETFKDVEKKRVPFMIMNSDVQFYSNFPDESKK